MTGMSEERCAEIIRDNARHACRSADIADRRLIGSSSREPEEDEHGFVELGEYRLSGMVWRPSKDEDPPKRTPYRPDLPLPWLEGRAS